MKRLLTRDEFCYWLDNNFTWSPFFKITNLCNYCCAHCCERSSPNEAPTFIPMADIRAITEQFKYVKNKMPVAVVSGGEPMMTYKHVPYYIPQIMKVLHKAGFAIELKTNAGWVLTDAADRIFNDQTEFFAKNPHAYFSYHLSLDRFHPQSLKTTVEFLRWYYENDRISDKASVHLFFDDAQFVTDTFMSLADKYNIMLDMERRPTNEFAKIGANLFSGKEKYIVIEPYSGIDNRGRARDNGIWTKQNTILKSFSNAGDTHAITFDNNGYSYFDCASDRVKVPYRNQRGKIKTIEQIKRELFNLLYDKYIIEETQK
ncbi:MAG: radical SAM protein [Alphaproteobacteria bacterium]|nr:radical SAM protein [Alphaproteobacteria bacterium]